tara:strand:+ start:831 stop:1301 length:471 start_codon:yes stop_codon:yes gene_type:complete
MAKIRKNASIESGLMEVLKILSDDEIYKAIGKTSSYIRKCSNPDLPQQIDHNDSFKLDNACIQKGKAPPLLKAYEYMIVQLLDKADNYENKDTNEMLVKSTILHGKLTELVKKAKEPKSERGTEISALEKKDIFEAISDLENKILKIKLTIDGKDK